MNTILHEFSLPSGQAIQLVHGDLTQERVDAIVNAANDRLQHGGGVAGAILRQGGGVIQTESDTWVCRHGPVSHAEPAYTSAGMLPCRYVIHAVGPVWGEGQEDDKLSAAVVGSLRLADQLKLASIAMPAISTGIYGFPRPRAARLILHAILSYFATNPTSGLKQVRLTLFDSSTLSAFEEAWGQVTGSKEQA
jgi:O-acetyl-ADP-ribose deacetylase (regulator of RNase III)